jgi:nucleoside-diphosphate-sugar epimerase
MKKVAILGATGYIGKSLLAEFLVQNSDDQIFVFSRDIEKLKQVTRQFKDTEKSSLLTLCHLSEFQQGRYDIIINATGVGDTRLLGQDLVNIFKVTEDIDSLIAAYLKKYPAAIYINLSSGAVYGDNFNAPITEETKATFSVNEFKVSEYYSVAKLHAEAKHRALKDYNIIDLRVFAFFSRFADPKAEFLMSEIVDCLVADKVFKTNSADIVRDFITPYDLFMLMKCVIASPSNSALDVYSKAPIEKFELLRELEQKFGLRYEISSDPIRGGNKFSKNIYYSENHLAKKIGYEPSHTSLQGITRELSKLLEK